MTFVANLNVQNLHYQCCKILKCLCRYFRSDGEVEAEIELGFSGHETNALLLNKRLMLLNSAGNSSYLHCFIKLSNMQKAIF